ARCVFAAALGRDLHLALLRSVLGRLHGEHGVVLALLNLAAALDSDSLAGHLISQGHLVVEPPLASDRDLGLRRAACLDLVALRGGADAQFLLGGAPALLFLLAAAHAAEPDGEA